MNAMVPGPLHGEILTSADRVSVVAALHPFKLEGQRFAMPAGVSITEIVAAAETRSLRRRISAGLHVHVDGHPIAPELWARVRVKAGRTVVLRAVPGSGAGNVLKSIFQLALVVLAAVAVPFLTPIIGAGFAAAVGAAIAVGGSLLANALFPPTPPAVEKRKETYSIGGGRNEAGRGQPIPVLLGRHRVQPKYGAMPYSEIAGNDQFLRMIFVWGYGPMSIEDIKIGETPLAEFQGVEVETLFGYADDPAITLYPAEVVQQDLSVALQNEGNQPWAVRTTAANIDEISVDFAIPALIRTNKKGGKEKANIRIHAEYRAYEDTEGAWIPWFNVERSGKTESPMRFSERLRVPRGRYDVRVRRIRADNAWGSGSASDSGLSWVALRGLRLDDHPISFAKPLAITALRIKASDQLNGVIDNLNGICTSRMTTWDGEAWVADTKAAPRESANPADLFRLVLQGPMNARPVATHRLDLPTLELWHAYCAAQGFRFNQLRDFTASVWDTLRDVCAAGRAMPLFRDGKWSVVWDELDAPVIQHFTPRNSWNFSGKRTYRRLPHALRVPFLNEARDWLEDERTIYRDGYTSANATLIEELPLTGITNSDLVWRHGRFHMAEAELRPETYQISVDMEHLVCTRGDRVWVAHDVPMFGLASGRVKNVAGRVVTLDEEVLLDPALDYAIRFRSSDGTSTYTRVEAGEGPSRVVTLVDSVEPAAGDLFMFGEAGRESAVLRVLLIAPGEGLSAELTLVDDAPQISQADQGEIPPFDSQISVPADPFTMRPYRLIASEAVEIVGGVPTYATTLRWSVVQDGAAQSYDVAIRPNEADAPDWRTVANVTATEARLVDLPPGPYLFRVRSLFPGGRFSGWSVPLAYTIEGADRRPPNVLNFRASALGDVSTLSWDPPAEPVSHVEIRYSPDNSGAATWSSAVTIIPRASGTSVQTYLQSGTYLARFVSFGGAASPEAARIVIEGAGISQMNVVERIVDYAPFEGAFDGTAPVGDGIQLRYTKPIFEFDSMFEIESLFDTGGIPDEGTYTLAETIDLGEVFTVRVTGSLLAYGVNLTEDIFAAGDVFALADVFLVEADDWQAEIEMRSTEGDPDASPQWGDWGPLVIGDYTGRAFQFRARLSSLSGGVTPHVQLIDVEVDMPDRVEGGTDVVVPEDGERIQFVPAFRELGAANQTFRDMQTGDYFEITNKSETGFDVRCFDAAGVPVARVMDWIAKGYGRRLN